MHSAYIGYFLDPADHLVNEHVVFSDLLEVVKVYVTFDNSIMDLKDNDQK